MKQLIEFTTTNGEKVFVEAEALKPAKGGVQDAARPGPIVAQATETFEQALGHLRPIASATIEALRGLTPDEVSVEVGVKFNAVAGIVIASAAGEAAITVRLTWKGGAPTGRPLP